MARKIDVLKLHNELEAAGLPVVSVHSDWVIEYSRALTIAEAAQAGEIADGHDGEPLQEVSMVEKVEALWRQVVEGNPQLADELQARRVVVRG